MFRTLYVGLVAVTAVYFGLSAATAHAQVRAQQDRGAQVQAQGPGRLVARSPDLVPIPSRIEHGVVSVRNVGTAASSPSVVTVNCHRPGEEGGCVDIPAAYLAQYTSAMYPNRLVVNVPAIQPGHVYNHNLPFWEEMDWPSGEAFQFDYVADAGNTNGESNEGNNTGSHVWNVP
jgi:hypothetical protein